MTIQYHAEVNKGSINMRTLGATLNQRAGDGWKLAHIFEQHGNTVLIYERDDRLDRVVQLLEWIGGRLGS